MRGAFAMTVAGLYAGSLYMASHDPLFYDLAILATGLILGIVANDCLRDLLPAKEREPYRGLPPDLERRLLDRNPEKTRNAIRLMQMLNRRLWEKKPALWFYSREANEFVESLGPEVLHLHDEALWAVVNEGEHYAFRSPTDTRRTIVMRKDFAEKALVLGGLP